jgi:group I intron endonuclease
MAFIYKATNKINGKNYIGRTSYDKLYKRISSHVWYSKHKNSNIPFANALRKYGKDQFEWKILEECKNTDMGQREIYWIDKIKPEYNVTLGGDGGRYGRKCPENVKLATKIANSKPVIDTRTGIIYESATEASKILGISRSSISRSCAKDEYKSRPNRKPWFRYIKNK